ncbi:MAG: non-heme iron oxygenase ferredoxin subunit [Gammaproteobacteria bacterium]|jgi:nitrite reductase/ring-hydroxylating ferredoxin subunit|nr:non-heme iron oxygenase ferredoxin subunit [Gammaproteobacteria bacterium]
MVEFVKVATTGELAPGWGKLVEVSDKRIALFNVDGKYYAIDDECTHEGGPLSEGELAGTQVVCPWHGAAFELTTGEVVDPPADEAVARYTVRVSGEDVEIEI